MGLLGIVQSPDVLPPEDGHDRAYLTVCLLDSGENLAEYGLLLSLIAVLLYVSVSAFGVNVGLYFGNLADAVKTGLGVP